MGRLKKEDAIKSGELKKGLVRFSFIANREVISRMKLQAKKDGVSIKDLMDKILSNYIEVSTGKKIERDRLRLEDITPENNNEKNLLELLKNKTA